MLSEKCKNCEEMHSSGVWISPEFAGNKVLLFCSQECKKEYLRRKLHGIKNQYPKYYEKIKKNKVKSIYSEVKDDV